MVFNFGALYPFKGEHWLVWREINIKNSILGLIVGICIAVPVFADGHRSAAPEGAMTYILSPADGATVSNPVTIVFGLEGMGVAPAGVEQDNTGHHHLLINTEPASLDLETSLPATDQIVHFGGGQTQVTQALPIGTHRLQLLLGDWSHVPHDPPVMSGVIEITVE